MAKTVTVTRGSVSKLAKQFTCTEQTVRNALRGVTSGEMTERIRFESVKLGFAIKVRPLSLEEYNEKYRED